MWGLGREEGKEKERKRGGMERGEGRGGQRGEAERGID
jgi:hypothetical protein